VIAQFSEIVDQIAEVGVARARVARKTVRVGAHVFAFASKVPLALAANAFAFTPTNALGVHEARVVFGERLARFPVFVLIDAETHRLLRR
jgi:hypothetical protein